MSRLLLPAAIALCGLLGPAPGADPVSPMPSLGRSVQFPPTYPRFDIPDLRGRAALLLFFQEW